MSTRVVVADDHPVLLAGMEHLLSQQSGLQVAGLVRDSTALVELISRSSVDVVVTDFSMPDGRYGDGIALLRFLRRRFPQIQLVVLTAMESPVVLSSILATGVRCIVSKSDPLQHLVPAIEAVRGGREYLSPEVQRLTAPAVVDEGSDDLPALSRRESEVLRMFAEGLSVMEIAERLGRSRKTVSTQKVAAKRKLGLTSDAEIFQYAIARRLVSASRQGIVNATAREVPDATAAAVMSNEKPPAL